MMKGKMIADRKLVFDASKNPDSDNRGDTSLSISMKNKQAEFLVLDS